MVTYNAPPKKNCLKERLKANNLRGHFWNVVLRKNMEDTADKEKNVEQ